MKKAISIVIFSLFFCGFLFLIFYSISRKHPSQIDFIGLTKEQVINRLYENEKNNLQPISIGINTSWKHFKTPHDAIKDQIVMTADVWSVNDASRCKGLFRYYQLIFFKNGRVFDQKVHSYSDGI